MRRRVVIAPVVEDALHAIWLWNATHHSLQHADAYLRYLRHGIARLATRYAQGPVIPANNNMRYLLLRRRSTGHGHVALYRLDADEVHVLQVFHTAQDWPTLDTGQ